MDRQEGMFLCEQKHQAAKTEAGSGKSDWFCSSCRDPVKEVVGVKTGEVAWGHTGQGGP